MNIQYWQYRYNTRDSEGEWENHWTIGEASLQEVQEKLEEACFWRYEEGYRGTEVRKWEPSVNFLLTEAERLRKRAEDLLKIADKMDFKALFPRSG